MPSSESMLKFLLGEEPNVDLFGLSLLEKPPPDVENVEFRIYSEMLLFTLCNFPLISDILLIYIY
jgi:hypothetical protein